MGKNGFLVGVVFGISAPKVLGIYRRVACVYMCVCRIRTCIRTVCVRKRKYVRTHVHTYVRMHVCMKVSLVHTHVRMHARAYVRVYVSYI